MARPSKPLISREGAAAAAIEAIEDVGLDKFSLNILAARLGVSAPSLYYHFRNKAELFEEVVRALLATVRIRYASGDSYEERILAICTAARRTLLDHPQTAALALQHFPRTVMLNAYEDAVHDAPYSAEHKLAVIEGTEKLTFGSALFAAAAMKTRGNAFPEFDNSSYPALAEAVNANKLDDDELFRETILIFLDGLRARYGADRNQSLT